jgi:hypothetical protein
MTLTETQSILQNEHATKECPFLKTSITSLPFFSKDHFSFAPLAPLLFK